MRTVLAEELLDNGEALAIECVEAPDAERAGEIRPFLGHKPEAYRAHIDKALDGDCDALETRFYLGRLAGEVVANVMTTECAGVGIFGHVFTREDQRRKGIIRWVIARQMDDFRRRDGATLLLGTGYGSSAYRIYAEAGFVDAPPCSPGTMRYDNPAAAPAAERFSRPDGLQIAPAAWRHWPGVALLGAMATPEYLRCPPLGLWGARLLEGPYVSFLTAARPGEALALETEAGVVFALAICQPDRRGAHGGYLVDLLAHPATPLSETVRLLGAIERPETRLQCLADLRDTARQDALAAAGYTPVATVPDQFREGEQWRDALLFSRTVPA